MDKTKNLNFGDFKEIGYFSVALYIHCTYAKHSYLVYGNMKVWKYVLVIKHPNECTVHV